MQEMLLFQGVAGQVYFPDSGPGNKTLRKGTATLGYFGEVTSAELFQGWEVAAAAGLEAGTEYSTPSTTWLKFVRNGKYLFISTTQLRTNIAWSELYAKGLVYGVSEGGPYPFGGTPVPQLIVMKKTENGKDWYLKPRLPSGSGVDPSVAPITQANLDASEWSQLMGRITASGSAAITDKWETFSISYVGVANNMQSLVQETLSTNVNNAFVRGDNSNANGQANNAKTSKVSPGGSWRAVLELIPGTELKDPYNLLTQVIGPSVPAIQQSPLAPDSVLSLVGIRQEPWDYKQPVITEKVTSDSVYGAANIQGSSNPTINPITLSGVNIA